MPEALETIQCNSQKTKGIPHNGTVNGNASSKPVLEGNFPASWYTEPRFFEFERRAIFSKHWLFTTHRLRLPEPGSYLRFEIAGFDFILVKNRNHEIQAFHNICRHRAYPLIDKDDADAGKKSILSCHYHGTPYTPRLQITTLMHPQVGLTV